MNKLEDLNNIFFTPDGMCRYKYAGLEFARAVETVTVLEQSSRTTYNVLSLFQATEGKPVQDYSIVLHRKHIEKSSQGDELWVLASVWNVELELTGNLIKVGPLTDIRFADPSVLGFPHPKKPRQL